MHIGNQMVTKRKDSAAPTKPRISPRMRGLTLAMAAAMATGGLLAPQRADAVFASEFTQVLNNVSLMFSQFQHYTRYIDDARKWQQQIQEMQRMIAKLRNMSLSLGFKPGQEWKKIPDPDTYLVEEACGAANGGGVKGVLSGMLGIDLRGDVFKQQYQRCAGVQIAKNYRWNATIEFMEESKRQMEQDFTKLQQQNTSSTEQGDMNKTLQDAAAMSSKYEFRLQNFEDEMKMYDIRIATLEQENTAVGKAAMRGSAGLIRNLTTAAALTAALCREGQCNDGN